MLYNTVVGFLKFVFLFVFRIKIIGKENIPKEGGVIFASNHKSNWDPLVIAVASTRRLRFMAKAELFKNKIVGKVITAVGAFPVERKGGDVGAIKTSLKILRDDGAMLIFPEGKRVANEDKLEAKPGTVMIAIRSKVPVLPIYISGKYRWFSKITVTFGEPIYYEEYYDEKPVVEELQDLSNVLLKTMRSYKVEEKKGKA